MACPGGTAGSANWPVSWVAYVSITWLWPYGCLMQNNSISHLFPDRQLCPCVMASETFPTTILSYTQHNHVMCWTSSGFTSHPWLQHIKLWKDDVKMFTVTSLPLKQSCTTGVFNLLDVRDPKYLCARDPILKFKRQLFMYKDPCYTAKKYYRYCKLKIM